MRSHREAMRRGIPITGTLGILRAAAVRQLLDLPTSFEKIGCDQFPGFSTPYLRNSWQKILRANGTWARSRRSVA